MAIININGNTRRTSANGASIWKKTFLTSPTRATGARATIIRIRLFNSGRDESPANAVVVP